MDSIAYKTDDFNRFSKICIKKNDGALRCRF